MARVRVILASDVSPGGELVTGSRSLRRQIKNHGSAGFFDSAFTLDFRPDGTMSGKHESHFEDSGMGYMQAPPSHLSLSYNAKYVVRVDGSGANEAEINIYDITNVSARSGIGINQTEEPFDSESKDEKSRFDYVVAFSAKMDDAFKGGIMRLGQDLASEIAGWPLAGILICQLRVEAAGDDLEVVCADLSGSDVSRMAIQPEEKGLELRRGIAAKLSQPEILLQIILPTGKLLQSSDDEISVRELLSSETNKRQKSLHSHFKNLNPNVELLDSKAITMLFTIIRDKNTNQRDYVMAADRLMNILAEEGIARLSSVKPSKVTTPCGEYEGLTAPVGSDICAVDIMRSGCILLEAVRKIMPELKTAKILIQRDEQTAEPILMYSKLPAGVENLEVMLCDPMLATGGSAVTAIDVLKKAGVKEENILFVNVVSCPEGILKLKEMAPGVRILTAAIDEKLNESKFIVPGLGDFGDRYYGTSGYKEGLWGNA